MENTLSNRYTHGHHESVLRSHKWRTAENSAGYLLKYLKSGMNILDVGCGPGTITLDFAEIVSPGIVVGIDSSAEVIDQAKVECERREITNAHFLQANLYDLAGQAFADFGFPELYDVVHAHQVLQHVNEPVKALELMAQKCTVGGVVAARDSDYHGATWYPEIEEMDEWMQIYQNIARKNGGEPDAGRRLLAWARSAGFKNILPSGSCWCFATPEDRDFWGSLWADRVLHSSFFNQALEMGYTEDTLIGVSNGWKRWKDDPSGFYLVVAGEVICSR